MATTPRPLLCDWAPPAERQTIEEWDLLPDARIRDEDLPTIEEMDRRDHEAMSRGCRR